MRDGEAVPLLVPQAVPHDGAGIPLTRPIAALIDQIVRTHLAGSPPGSLLTVWWAYRSGQTRFSTTHDVGLTERMAAQVNVTSANLLVQATDVRIPGTGLDLVVNRFYNSHRAEDARGLGHGWQLDVGGDVELVYHVGAMWFRDPTGATWPLTA